MHIIISFMAVIPKFYGCVLWYCTVLIMNIESSGWIKWACGEKQLVFSHLWCLDSIPGNTFSTHPKVSKPHPPLATQHLQLYRCGSNLWITVVFFFFCFSFRRMSSRPLVGPSLTLVCVGTMEPSLHSEFIKNAYCCPLTGYLWSYVLVCKSVLIDYGIGYIHSFVIASWFECCFVSRDLWVVFLNSCDYLCSCACCLEDHIWHVVQTMRL